jgi:large subunit ribosomal protein L25
MPVTVECRKRPEGSKPNALRRQGLIPAALYGHQGTESVSLTLNEKDANVLLRQASVNNTLVDLTIPDLSWNGKVLIREVQAHPWKKMLYHLSFFSVATHASVEVTVPLNPVGDAPGVKQGGILEQMLTELTVQCAPDRIPASIEIDISKLNIGDHWQVSDLALPEGVVATDESNTMVLSIIAPAVMAEEVPAAAEEATEES